MAFKQEKPKGKAADELFGDDDDDEVPMPTLKIDDVQDLNINKKDTKEENPKSIGQTPTFDMAKVS